MIELSIAQGVDRIVATPHHSPHYHHYDKGRLLDRLAEIKERIGDRCELFLGQELFYDSDMLKKLGDGGLLCMGESRYVLIEFYPWESFYNIKKAVREIAMLGYRPVLAHVERFEALDSPEKIGELTGMGAYMQMNFTSITGGLFDREAHRCRGLLKEGLIHFLGTDMHNTGSRAPRISDSLKWMKKHLDEDYVKELCYINAGRMLENKLIHAQ